MLRVFKFGGALLSSAENLKHLYAVITEFSCQPMVVVVSAIGKTTNALENLLRLKINNDPALPTEYFNLKSFHLNLIRDLKSSVEDELMLEVENSFRDLWDSLHDEYDDYYEAYDSIVSYGEKISSLIVTTYLRSRKEIVREIYAGEIIKTDSNFTDASINWKLTEKNIKEKVLPSINNHELVITQGFIGSDSTGKTTTLGREGSDFTAAVLASVLKASEIIIWKDVPGIMNADPKVFKDAVKLEKLSYHEAIELAFYGAKVVHPKTIQPLKDKKIPLQVRYFFKPFIRPTVISDDGSEDEKIHKIIIKENQVLLSFSSKNLDFIAENHLSEIFKTLTDNKVHINIMQNSAVSFSVSFDYDEVKLEAVINELKNKFYIKYNKGLQLLTLRHYSPDLVERFVSGKTVFLEQKNRTTVQMLLK